MRGDSRRRGVRTRLRAAGPRSWRVACTAAVIAAATVCVLAGATSALGVGTASSPSSRTTLTTGFASDPLLDNPGLEGASAATQNHWLQTAVSEGARVVRVNVEWSQIAPAAPPPGFVASNPSSPGYRWAGLDRTIRALTAHGLTPLLMVYSAPRWAEGPAMPARTYGGTWEPNAAKFGAFATAAATRYSGSLPDPLHAGGYLPRVRLWQAWNEPDVTYYLAPQWTAHGQPNSPNLYRALLNSFYFAVKAVDPTNFVISGGTAPFGDSYAAYWPGGARMSPLFFYRALFCVTKTLRPTPCQGPVYLDAVDHHPYSLYPAQAQVHARRPDDVTVPDVWKITRLLNAGVRTGHVLPDTHKQVWVGELSWDTRPPSSGSYAVSPSLQACNVELSDFLLWRQGVSTVMFLQLRDWPLTMPHTATLIWGGMYYSSGAAKPAATAFRFPLVAQRLSAHTVLVWSRSPATGMLVIRRRLSNGGSSVLLSRRVLAGQVLLATVRFAGPVNIAASVAGQSSLRWTGAKAECR